MTSGTCSDDTPFYIDGEEVLCMRCEHRGKYEVVRDELHHKDIFWAFCEKLDKHVGLPMNKCDDFQPVSQKSYALDAENALKCFDQLGKMCSNILMIEGIEDYPDGCLTCPFYPLCRDFIKEGMTLAELMSEYSSVAFALVKCVEEEE